MIRGNLHASIIAQQLPVSALRTAKLSNFLALNPSTALKVHPERSQGMTFELRCGRRCSGGSTARVESSGMNQSRMGATSLRLGGMNINDLTSRRRRVEPADRLF